MRIGYDVDGVLADFNAAYINLVAAKTGKDLFPNRPFEITTWDYPESYGYTKEDMTRVWAHIAESDSFWKNLVAYPGVYGYLSLRIKQSDDVYFVTSRPGSTAKAQTEYWLRSNGFRGEPTVLISSEKGEVCHALKLDAYIDDRVENCQDVANKSPETLCVMLARPWNRPIDGVHRITDLDGFRYA